MVTRDQRRAQLVPPIARAFRERDFRTAFGGRSMGGSQRQRVIVVLPDDSMGYVFDRLDHGSGVVVMPTDRALNVAVFAPATPARIAVAEEDDSTAQIHRDSDVTMLFAYLRQKDGPIVIEEIAAHLIREQFAVPC